MKNKYAHVLSVGALCVLAGTSFAQGGGNNGGGNGGNRPNFANMTPAQRDAMRAQMRANQIRNSLTGAGFDDAATQDAVVAFAAQQSQAATALLPKIEAIRAAFRDKADDTTVQTALAAYRSAVTDASSTREEALKDLEKTVSFSTKPKLEALLTMLGLIGDENGFVSNLAGQAQLPGAGGGQGGPGGMGGGPGGPGGMGGFGGGPGGMGGFGGGPGGPGGMGGGPGGGGMGGPGDMGGGPMGGGPGDNMAPPPPPGDAPDQG